jgi:hypothetical protein
MKKAILILSIIITSSIEGIGQNNALVLKNISSGKEEMIQEGNILMVTCKNGLVFKGQFIIDKYVLNSDDVIMIDTNRINVDQIKSIKMKFSGQNAIGGIFAGLGACLTIGGVSEMNSAKNKLYGNLPPNTVNPDQVAKGCLSGTVGVGAIYAGVAAIITGIVVLASGKKYEITKWDISIRTK